MPGASDDEYTAFLEKANQPKASALGSAGAASAADNDSPSHAKQQFTTSSVDSEVPQALSSIDAYYSSDADEWFEPVSLKLEDLEAAIATGITGATITKLTGYEDVESVPLDSFDPRGHYKSVVDAVRTASGSDARIFRVALQGARCEYWILGLDKANERVVGMRAPAVES